MLGLSSRTRMIPAVVLGMIGLYAACSSDESSNNAGGGGGPCAVSAECSPGRVCDPAAKLCVPGGPCTSEADCPLGAICHSGQCSSPAPGALCESNADCPAGQTCTGGYCGCGGDLYGADAVPPN